MATESTTLDEVIIAALKDVVPGSKVISVVKHGTTNWSTGLKIELEAGSERKSFFSKALTNPTPKHRIIESEELVGMAEAEFEGQRALSAVIPENAVKPLAWGYYKRNRIKSWFLTYFRKLNVQPLMALGLLPIINQLHQQSVSPTGKFGFHVTLFFGPPPMLVEWTGNWEEFWTRLFRSDLGYARRVNSGDPELVQLAGEVLDKVVPRLPRPLQTGGRNIKPSLCHGDLWEGNIQTDRDTGRSMLFDSCAFYGHAEIDLQCLRAGWATQGSFGSELVPMYREQGESEPVEDFDDRNALYAIRSDIMANAMGLKRDGLLERAKLEMRRLIAKYPQGLAGFYGDLTPTRVLQVTSRKDME